jgi:hypothetical protein
VLVDEDQAILTAGDHVELTGTISREAFPGPPNYESIYEGDEPRTYWILSTDKKYYGEAKSVESGEPYRMDGSLDRFHLLMTREQYEEYRSLLTKKVRVKGMAVTGHTVHHKTKLLISVSNMSALPQGPGK